MRAHVDAHALARWPCSGESRRDRWPGCPIEETEQLVGNEACPRGIDVPIPLRALAMGEEALRDNEVEIVLGARHRDIERPSSMFIDPDGVLAPRPLTRFLHREHDGACSTHEPADQPLYLLESHQSARVLPMRAESGAFRGSPPRLC
jgi:hypothetical protein